MIGQFWQTDEQVERLKEAKVRRFHYDSHDQLRQDLDDFVQAYNFARRLKILKGLTPYEFICKIWASESHRYTANLPHQMPGLVSRAYPTNSPAAHA